jgi:hypothetical protein
MVPMPSACVSARARDPKGRQGLFDVEVSRNGRVLFLSPRPLGDVPEERVFIVVCPWPGRAGATTCRCVSPHRGAGPSSTWARPSTATQRERRARSRYRHAACSGWLRAAKQSLVAARGRAGTRRGP